jgi:hypothetical protein
MLLGYFLPGILPHVPCIRRFGRPHPPGGDAEILPRRWPARRRAGEIASPQAGASGHSRHPCRRRIGEAIVASNPTDAMRAVLVARIVRARRSAENAGWRNDPMKRENVPGRPCAGVDRPAGSRGSARGRFSGARRERPPRDRGSSMNAGINVMPNLPSGRAAGTSRAGMARHDPMKREAGGFVRADAPSPTTLGAVWRGAPGASLGLVFAARARRVGERGDVRCVGINAMKEPATGLRPGGEPGVVPRLNPNYGRGASAQRPWPVPAVRARGDVRCVGIHAMNEPATGLRPGGEPGVAPRLNPNCGRGVAAQRPWPVPAVRARCGVRGAGLNAMNEPATGLRPGGEPGAVPRLNPIMARRFGATTLAGARRAGEVRCARCWDHRHEP